MVGLVTVPEAARALNIDARTLRAWLRDGKAPGLGVKIGERFLVRRSVLDRILGGGFSLRSIGASVATEHETPEEEPHV
jgi:excisionase family DNA binding protein